MMTAVTIDFARLTSDNDYLLSKVDAVVTSAEANSRTEALMLDTLEYCCFVLRLLTPEIDSEDRKLKRAYSLVLRSTLCTLILQDE